MFDSFPSGFGFFDQPWIREPKIRKILENQDKLREKPRIETLKSFKRLKRKGLPAGYTLLKGKAEGIKFEGTIYHVSQVKFSHSVYKLRSNDDLWELNFFEGDGKTGQIITVEWSAECQGDFFQLQNHMTNAGKYLFGVLGYHSFIARAAIPRTNCELRGREWRDEQCNWRRHRKTGKMIRISRLLRMWFHIRFMIPEMLLNQEAAEDELRWLSPDSLASMDDSTLELLEEELGSSPRRWKLTDAKI